MFEFVLVLQSLILIDGDSSIKYIFKNNPKKLTMVTLNRLKSDDLLITAE